MSDYSVADHLASLHDPGAANRYLAAEPVLQTRETVELLADEVARRLHANVEEAERLCEAAAWVAERLDDDYCRARVVRARAHLSYRRGEYLTAIMEYEQALDLFHAQHNPIEAARTLSSSLQPLIYLGHYEEALRRAEEARQLFELGGDRLRLARLDANLANLFLRQDRFEEALDLYQRAHERLVELGTPTDVAVALTNIAGCYVGLNRFDEAIAAHSRARDYCETHDLPRLVVGCDYNIAYLYYMRGEYTQAIELYQLARERSERAEDPYYTALCDMDQAELFLELNLVAEGVELAERAFEGFERLEMGYEASKALVARAIGLSRLGNAREALDLFARAREIFLRENNEVWPALVDAYRALILQQEGRLDEARSLGESALDYFSGTKLPSKAALCELFLARIHLAAGELRSAAARCRSALARLEFAETPQLSYRAQLLLGQAEEALGDREAARNAYRAAHALLEDLRSRLDQDELKVGFLRDKQVVYESLIWLTFAEGGPNAATHALEYVEQAKSRILADLMAFRAQQLPARGAGPEALVQEVRALRKELSWFQRQLDLAELGSATLPSAELERLRRESRNREDRLVRTVRRFRQRDMEFVALQGGRAFDLDAVRSTLAPGTTLVEYYQARDTVLAIVVDHERVEAMPLAPVSRVRHLLRLLQLQLSKFRLGAEYVSAFGNALQEATQAHLRELYHELVGPIRECLDGDSLVVLPHDFLHYVPFHALLDGERYLCDDFVVSYAPSASVHHLCAVKPVRAGGRSLVLGVPDAATPRIREEVEAVAASLPGARLLLGSQATEANLRRYGRDSRIVHIATHGLFRYDNPMFSSIQLGDSRLNLFDLYELELPAELITLSGCGTGLNVVEGGDELMGLVRGLLYAGTRAALVTLWDVNDESTARCMKAFYELLQGGIGCARALQQATRELRQEYSHPYYWAPFVLVGASRAPVENEKSGSTPLSESSPPHP